MAAKKYATWKKALWEAWRAFVPAFLAVLYIQFQAGVELEKWQDWLPALLFGAFIAGVRAVFKWARERFGAGDYSKFIYKLPA